MQYGSLSTEHAIAKGISAFSEFDAGDRRFEADRSALW